MYVLHNEGLSNDLALNPLLLFSVPISLFLCLETPEPLQEICCQLRISVCNFEVLSHGLLKLLMTLQSPAKRGSRRCVSFILTALRFSKRVGQVMRFPHVEQGCAHRNSSRLIRDKFCDFLCDHTNKSGPSPGRIYGIGDRLLHMCWSTTLLRFCLMGMLGLVLDQHIKTTIHISRKVH